MPYLSLLVALLFALPAWADTPAIREYTAKSPADATYQRLYDALEAGGYFVIFEPNMGRTLAGMADKLGADYNRNQLSTMRSLVFCNPVVTNRIANADPALLALCPLHITLTHRDGVSTVYFSRPSVLAAGSAGEAAALQIETAIDGIIRSALHDQ